MTVVTGQCLESRKYVDRPLFEHAKKTVGVVAVKQPEVGPLTTNKRLHICMGGYMAQRKRSGRRKYSKGAGKTVASAMRRKKRGTLRTGRGGKGGKVKNRKQAIAIGLSEARRKGAKVPRRKAA